MTSALGAHEPKRSRGVVLISVPYFPDANALPTLVPLVDRTIYPADQYPDGQWDYYRYYTTHFKAAVADLDADKAASLASIFRPGNPPRSARFCRPRQSRATEGASALRTMPRPLSLTQLFGRRRISRCWYRRSRLMVSAPPARGT